MTTKMTRTRKSKLPDANQELVSIAPYLDVEALAQIILNSPEWAAVAETLDDTPKDKIYPTDPVEFMRDILGYQMWPKLEEICRSVQINHNTVVESGYGIGKSLSCAAIAMWWMSTRDPAQVVTLAPCYDNQTEILTDSGWKLFKDLTETDKVAQLKDNKIDFILPKARVKFKYAGEMIGYKSQLIDFLVTPNHRCLYDRKMEGNYNGKIYEAQEIFEKDGRFQKIAEWDGEDTGISLEWAEFLGFWFAEGYAQVEPIRRHYRVTLTNTNVEYVNNLLKSVGFFEKAKLSRKQNSDNCYDWTINSKELAAQFIKYGNSHTKRVPNFIRIANRNIIAAFLHGFEMGDGYTDKLGTTRLTSCNRELAGDLQELALKCGIISNMNTRHMDTKYKSNYTMYDVSYWRTRGKYPSHIQSGGKYRHSNLYPGWYKEAYDEYVYCVNVQTGIVLVRRNGKYLWSGNTFSQIQNIIWSYIRDAGRKAELPGTILEAPRWKINDSRIAYGISPRRSSDTDLAAMQGRHNKNLLVIMDEAAGLPRSVWEVVQGLVVGGDNRCVSVGNPIEQSGPFWDATNHENWHHIRVSCLDHPNVVTGTELIPGAVTREWVNDRCKDWATECSPDTPEAIYIPWQDRYYKPLPIFMAKVLGIAPEQAEDQLIKLSWVIDAQQRVIDVSKEQTVVGVDSAPRGGDDNVLCTRQGNKIYPIKRMKGQDTQQLAEWLALEMNQTGAVKGYIDDVGPGIGVTDRARRMGLPVMAVNFASRAIQRKRFANLRAECYWTVRELLREGKMSLPNDPMLVADLTAPKYAPDPYGRILIESKDDIRARIGRSPDAGDGLALSYAVPITEASEELENQQRAMIQEGSWGGSRWLVRTPNARHSRWRK